MSENSDKDTALEKEWLHAPVYFHKTSLVDYPEKIAAALFFPSCNLRCPWCHNGSLIEQTSGDMLVPLEDALAHIVKRARLLGGVVLSGGEPTLFNGIAGLITAIQRLGLSVKLDTNGTKPDVLATLLETAKPDYIAMDLKWALRRYVTLLPGKHRANGAANGLEAKVLESIALIRNAFESGKIQAEFRSLIFPHHEFTPQDVEELAPLTGTVPWNFRPFKPGSCLEAGWNKLPETRAEDVERFTAYSRTLRS